jgi:hypothetical protein
MPNCRHIVEFTLAEVHFLGAILGNLLRNPANSSLPLLAAGLLGSSKIKYLICSSVIWLIWRKDILKLLVLLMNDDVQMGRMSLTRQWIFKKANRFLKNQMDFLKIKWIFKKANGFLKKQMGF